MCFAKFLSINLPSIKKEINHIGLPGFSKVSHTTYILMYINPIDGPWRHLNKPITHQPSNTLHVSFFPLFWNTLLHEALLMFLLFVSKHAESSKTMRNHRKETAILFFRRRSSLSGSIAVGCLLRIRKNSLSFSRLMNRFGALICGFLCLHHYSKRDVTSIPYRDLLAFISQAWERALSGCLD